MSKEILINIEPQEKRVAIVKDGQLEEFYIERPQKTIVGNIYKGKIEAVIPSINGAFVDIGLPKKGFLYLSELEDMFDAVLQEEGAGGKRNAPREVKKGQEILVQVVKESFGTKGPRLSCQIGIAGRYLVCMPADNRIGVSKRIEDEVEKKRLKQIMNELKLPKDHGYIVRTAAFGKSKQELFRDARFLIKLWLRLEKNAKRKSAPVLVYEDYDLLLRVLRDSFSDDVTKVIVDAKAEFYRIHKFMRVFLGALSKTLEFYKGDNLFEEKNVEKQVSRIFESKIFLKSKAYLIIEPTEGLVVIDVNSGGFHEKIRQEEAAFKINCEAAIEAAHQLCLRDLGGIIVIDFIDMERESHRREVLQVLKRELSKDKAKYDVVGISKFGLVEMTRERIHNTVQTLSYQVCPYCYGKGKVKSALTMAIYTLKEVKKFLKNKSVRQISVMLNPMVYDEVLKDKQSMTFIERRFRVKIDFVSNPTMHIEEIRIS